jgi:hypothetical protein
MSRHDTLSPSVVLESRSNRRGWTPAYAGATKIRTSPRLAWIVLMLLSLWSGLASAHALSTATVDITRNDEGAVRVEVDVALRDLALTLPLDADRDESVTWGEMQAQRAALFDFVQRGVGVADARGACALRPTLLAVRDYDDGAYAAIVLRGACGDGALRVDYDLLFARDPQHRALVTLRDGATTGSAILRGDARHATLGRAAASPFLAFVREGVHHILIGTDHLAFLLCLLLPASLVRRDGAWLAAASLGASLRPVLGIVTAFTLAHSLTLSLAALGWVTPASRWVEAAIAASVLLAALNNVRPVDERRTWLVAFAFGLVHGFGFAGALGELGLPTQARFAALVGFNAGVELGQLAAVAAVMPLLFALRRRAMYSRVVMPLASLAIAGVAAMWCWQRVVG